MCLIEERIYFDADGHRQAFEKSFLCNYSRSNRLCPNVERKTVPYLSRPPQISRDDASSPASYNPPTPTEPNSYILEEREPSSLSRRSSKRDKRRVINPELVITIGGPKDKGKQYAGTSAKYKRSSLGASSIESNDIAAESPGSEASYTLRTGFTEAALPPTGSAYSIRSAVPHRHNNSASSFTTSSQPPSLYAPSDPESPSSRRMPRNTPTVVHNTFSDSLHPSSPTVARGSAPAPGPSSPYRTTLHVPRDSADNVGIDGLFPTDYSEFQGLSKTSYNSKERAPAPEITDRDEERARQRKARAEAARKRQEKADHEMAKGIAQDEEARQVRFELGRADARAKERAENSYAEREKRRAEEREEARRHKIKQQNLRAAEEARRQKLEEQDRRAAEETRRQKLGEQTRWAAEEARRQKHQEENERAAKAARKEADRLREDIARKEREVKEAESKLREKPRHSRPPTREPTVRHRRRSMSQHEVNERNRLLAEDERRMALEREAAERLEREEAAALLLQQQQQPQYWDPRGGSRIPMTNDSTGLGRRNSVSGRRGSISSAGPPPALTGLGRRNSHRVAIVQPSPPVPLNNAFAPQPRSTRPPSARHSSYDAFAPPPARTSNTSQENPFAQPGVPLDPWDGRGMQDVLPHVPTATQHVHQGADERHHQSLRRRGEEVIERAADGSRIRHHDRARQATRKMNKAVGFEDDYEDSDA